MPDFAWLAHSARMSEHSPVTDLLIIGGGINGCGIARDAAGRGLSVILVEQDDLASHTSSASTKLIHGGLRYLEYKEFRLVREALAERERLLAIAPHIIWPLRFVLPHGGDMRPAWLLRLGLLIYDNIGGRRRLPGSQSLRFDGTGLGAGLKPGITRGFAYSDCWVEDSRLVVLNAMDAAERGASIRTRTRLTAAHRKAGLWHAELLDQATGRTDRITARRLVNAAGPWVASILGSALGQNAHASSRLVKGSHIVVPRLYPGEHAYLLQNTDRRVIFTIPYEQDFTLIGTTDIAFTGDASHVEIDADETRYLCDCVTQWLQAPVTPKRSSGAIPAYAPCTMTAPKTPPPSPATTCSTSTATSTKRPSSPSSAARSRPTAALPNTPWIAWASPAHHGPPKPPSQAATCRTSPSC